MTSPQAPLQQWYRSLNDRQKKKACELVGQSFPLSTAASINIGEGPEFDGYLSNDGDGMVRFTTAVIEFLRIACGL